MGIEQDKELLENFVYCAIRSSDKYVEQFHTKNISFVNSINTGF